MGQHKAWVRFVLLPLAGACSPNDARTTDAVEFREEVGTPTRTGSGAGFVNNGLHDPQIGGLDPAHALVTDQGLDGTKLDDPDRLATAEYVVECALPVGESVSKVVGGELMTFEGMVGLAPEWQHGSCDQDCQEWVSACVLARTNVSGQTVMLWFQADHPALGTSSHPDYPHYEASFFGNLFSGDEQAFMCPGTLTGSVFAQLEGRTCSNLVGGYCDFTTYLACDLLPRRCDFIGLLSPTAVDCERGEIPDGTPLHTISTYVATPLL